MFSSSEFNGQSQSSCNKKRLYVYYQTQDSTHSYFQLMSFNNQKYIELNHDNYNGQDPCVFEYNNHLWYMTDKDLIKFPVELNEEEACINYKDILINNDDITRFAFPEKDTLIIFTYHHYDFSWGTKKVYMSEDGNFIVDPVKKINLPSFNPDALYQNENTEINNIIPFHDTYIINYRYSAKGTNNSYLAYFKNSKLHEFKELKDCVASTIIKGSIKGMRGVVYGGEDCNERFTLFTISKMMSNGIHPIDYYEYCIKGETPELVCHGRVNVPASLAPKKILDQNELEKKFFIKTAYRYFPKNFAGINQEEGNIKPDGLQQLICLMFPNSIYSFTRMVFISDVWRPDPSTIVSSTDVDNDSIYGNDIRKFWNLIGVVDGAPPCSVDWDTWDSIYPEHTNEKFPTFMEFSQTQGNSLEISKTTEDKFTIGESLKFKKSFKETGKFSDAWEHKTSTKYEVSITNTQKFHLDRITQNYGYFLWSIPQIMRISYQAYPYWDENTLINPIDSTLQYMFRTNGISLKIEAIELNNPVFAINSPNDLTMEPWKLINRTSIDQAHSLIPSTNVGSFGWSSQNNQEGESLSFKLKTENSQSSDNKYGFDIEIEANKKILKVFEIGLSVGTEFSWERENTYTISNETEIIASLENILHKEDGINVDDLNIQLYRFWQNPIQDWWFYNSLPADSTQKPWYIAYSILDSKARINLISPNSESLEASEDILFNWETINEELNDFKIFIGTSPYLFNKDIVYQETLGNKKSITLDSFNPLAGETYYWRICGTALSDETIWSDVKQFNIKESKDENNDVNILKVKIYPNPISRGNINAKIESQVNGEIDIDVFDSQGNHKYSSQIHHFSEISSQLIIPVNNFNNGVYTIRFESKNDLVSKKFIIMK